MKHLGQMLVNTLDLSRLLHCSPSAVGDLERAGVIRHMLDKNGSPIRGQWDAFQAVPAAVDHYRAQRDKAKAGRRGDALDAARIKKLAIDTKMAELRFTVASGEMLPCEVVKKVYAGREITVANKIRQVAPNCAKLCEGRNVEEIEFILQREHDNILREFDAIDQATLLKLNKQYIGQMLPVLPEEQRSHNEESEHSESRRSRKK